MGSNCAELFDGSGQLKPSAERHSGAVLVAAQPVLAAGAFLSDDSKMNGFDWRRMCQAFALMIAGLFTTVAVAQEPERTHTIPFLPSASDELGRIGVARVINHSDEAGEVRIDAIDDEGESYGPVMLAVDAGEAVHFNSDDLENGNAAKGLSGDAGPGQGALRLQLSSELDIEVLSYVRTSDGFLTAMHDTAPSEDGKHRIAFFNPGSNTSQVSRLRLVNPGEEAAEVSIVGVDDRGESPGSEVTTTIASGASRTFTAAALESGGEGTRGCAWRRRGQVAVDGGVCATARRDEPAVGPRRVPDQPVDGAGERGGQRPFCPVHAAGV